MAKAVFRPNELIAVQETYSITNPIECFNAPLPSEEEVEIEQDFDEYLGPTVDELRMEAEAFKLQWDSEREKMINSAKAEADGIMQAANLVSLKEKQQAEEDAQKILDAAREEAEKIIAEVHLKAAELEEQSRKTLDNERNEALEQAREEGRAEGYAEGKTEVDRLIDRTQTVLERAQNKRGDILAETEQQIIDLVLLISRKVVKIISETQREVIVSNVVQALRKVKDRGSIIIRVNIADVKLTTDHTKDFIKLLEGVKSIQVVEDSSVDSGGCIIETDFGEIDARISSQLAELEAKILEISPIRSRTKSVSRASVPDGKKS
ncbi:MAG: flagellar assembly protein FliH [Treponema sp.]|nr:flagellar assembly protein FliH [Treponema sp.]